jgi:hypothetical protein
LAEIALRLAEDLDSASYGSSHASSSKALTECLDELHSVGARRGHRLAVVTELARR